MTWWKYRAVTPTEGNQELSRRAIVTIVAVLVAVVAAAVTLDSMGVPFERLMTWAGAGLGGAILVVGGLSLTYLVIVDYAVLGLSVLTAICWLAAGWADLPPLKASAFGVAGAIFLSAACVVAAIRGRRG